LGLDSFDVVELVGSSPKFGAKLETSDLGPELREQHEAFCRAACPQLVVPGQDVGDWSLT